MLRLIAIFGALMAVSLAAPHARAGNSEPGLCKPGFTDDDPKPIPAALVSRARRVFGLRMQDLMVEKSVVYRCMDGKTMLCATGANLPCGKANVSRDLPGVADWCRDHAQAQTVPMFVTGHDTIYRWGCADGKPKMMGAIDTVDTRGFLARVWKNAGN